MRGLLERRDGGQHRCPHPSGFLMDSVRSNTGINFLIFIPPPSDLVIALVTELVTLPPMPRGKNMIGERYGRLTVIARSGQRSPKGAMWICSCDCGGQKTVAREYLVKGTTKSCGCLSAETVKHGKTDSPEQRAWQSAKARCFNPNNHNYPHYGGRGITMCNRWRYGEGGLSGFHCFLIDVGERPDGYMLDRINNDGNYEPGNVRWVTYLQSQNNQQKTVWITDLDGEKISMANLCRKHNVPYTYFRHRYLGNRRRSGKGLKPWPLERILAKAKLLYPNYRSG